jgi:hypothetical protein
MILDDSLIFAAFPAMSLCQIYFSLINDTGQPSPNQLRNLFFTGLLII